MIIDLRTTSLTLDHEAAQPKTNLIAWTWQRALFQEAPCIARRFFIPRTALRYLVSNSSGVQRVERRIHPKQSRENGAGLGDTEVEAVTPFGSYVHLS